MKKSLIGVFLWMMVLSACVVEATPTPTVAANPPTPTFTATATVAPTLTPTLQLHPSVTVVNPVTGGATPTPTSTLARFKPIERNPSELRAAWVHDNSIATAAKTDEIVRRAELGHINVIVANVFTQGMALYDSQLIAKHSQVASDFNPLQYLVERAHQKGIQVQAWFVNGPVEFKDESKIIQQHPDWAIVGPDGKKMNWLNFQRADVRQFIGDLVWEVVDRYGVDGIFFDFTRYPGPEWGFDPYSISAFNSSHNFNLEELRYPALPAYGYFEGNPISQPTTAQVLAKFSNGTPALTFNSYGKGQVVIINWRASERRIAADSEIMKQSIKQLLKEGGQVYTYRPDGELDDNAKQGLEGLTSWLKDLGLPDQHVGPEQLKTLAPNSVLLVTFGFDIPAADAALLQNFVNQGGGLIFNDGPVRSIVYDSIRALTGMQGRGKHMEDWTTVVPVAPNALMPNSNRPVDLATAQSRDAQWKEFRKQGVNALIQGVYKRVKAQYPQVDVSVTVTSNQTSSSQLTMQDWRAWLEGHYVDYIVPRGYVEDVDELDAILVNWQPVMQKYKNVTLGVSTFSGKHNLRELKNPSQILEEINRARQAGSYGIMLWNLDFVNDEQLKALASGPFK
ncbi:MAG: family 10 glycosylhydrolase [Chloroflexi bacterium]|nr:family 10 glycosylhydrolase [Chloroflexota bacterium]